MVMDCEPIENLPAPDIVGREFVRQYYTLLNEAPQHAHRFYNANSYFVHGSMTKPAVGQVEIHQKIQQLNFRDCHAKINQVDSQVTLGNGVVVQVSGELSNDGLPMRRFSQTFVLGTQSPKKYYVHNDIFRYQDTLQSDEEMETQPEKQDEPEIEQPEQQNFYPPVTMEQPPVVAQPIVTPGLNVNAPPHTVNVNGTGHRAAEIEIIDQVQEAPIPPVTPHVNGATQLSSIETSPTSISSRTGPIIAAVEDPAPPVPEINNKDVYEEDTYQPQVAETDSKKTYATLVRGNQPGPRGPPPSRAGRNMPSVAAPTTPPAVTAVPPPAATPSVRNDPIPDLPSGGPTVRYPDCHQIFMGNIPPDCTEGDLKPLFEEFGRVVEVRININRREPNCRNYGFVTFEDPSAVSQCLHAKHVLYKDIPINVEEKKRQTKFNHDMSSGRGQTGRGRGPGSRGPGPRGAGSFTRGPPAPGPPRPSYSAKR